ncbi:hypothetical protein [Actinomadura rugatobispora]|uniref:Uncharacterized protein n=1 Tax=Actinomadura rugatobispora TaxID=1994 RepID=A0ABW1AGT0_9ACTN
MKVALVVLLFAVFVGLFYFLDHDEQELAAGSVAAGDRPSPADGQGFAYRMSAGQTVGSTYTLPNLKRRWTERIGVRPYYYLYGAVEFRADRRCASNARFEWRLGRERDRLPLTHRVRFNGLRVAPGSLRLSVRLDAPAPCSGTLWFHKPTVANIQPYRDSETRSSPSVETVRRWGGPPA